MPTSPAYDRFIKSMQVGYDQWHDGIGYDLDALAALTADERADARKLLAGRAGRDWRDVEALEALQKLESRHRCAVDRGNRRGPAGIARERQHRCPPPRAGGAAGSRQDRAR
jgi:hypothetical protein